MEDAFNTTINTTLENFSSSILQVQKSLQCKALFTCDVCVCVCVCVRVRQRQTQTQMQTHTTVILCIWRKHRHYV